MGGEQARARLRELGLSVREMSRVLGVPRRVLKRVLRGEEDDPVLRAAVAAALKMPVSALPKIQAGPPAPGKTEGGK